MSQPLTAFLTLPLLAAILAAQTPPEGIHIYPDTLGTGTTGLTRLTFGSAGGEAIVQYPKSHFEGIGDGSMASGTNNPVCSLLNLSWVIQDQNQQTAHTLGVRLRAAASGGGPDNSKTIYAINATTPTATGTGPAAWILWFQSPINQTIACKGDLFFGLVFSANSNWPNSDGLGTHTAFYSPTGTQKGDAVAPRTNVPNLCWEIDANNKVSQPSTAQVLDYKLISQYSMLQVGVRHKTGQSNHGSDDGFGVAALYPSIAGGSNGRQDGAIVRITDNPPGAFGGRYLLFLSLSTGTQLKIPPIQLAGLFGSIYIGPAGQFPLGGGNLSTTASQTVVLLAPAGSIPKEAVGTNVFFQAATTRQNSSVVAITNMCGIYY